MKSRAHNREIARDTRDSPGQSDLQTEVDICPGHPGQTAPGTTAVGSSTAFVFQARRPSDRTHARGVPRTHRPRPTPPDGRLPGALKLAGSSLSDRPEFSISRHRSDAWPASIPTGRNGITGKRLRRNSPALERGSRGGSRRKSQFSAQKHGSALSGSNDGRLR